MKKLMIVGMLFASMGLFAQEAPKNTKPQTCEKKCDKKPNAPTGQEREVSPSDRPSRALGSQNGKVFRNRKHVGPQKRSEMQAKRKSVHVDEKM